jgi:hypothetical protein
MITALSLAVRAAHDGSAVAAAAIARRVSSVPMFGITPNIAAVAGLCTGSVPPLSAPTQLPSMKPRSRNKRGSWSFMFGSISTYVIPQKLYAALERKLRRVGFDARAILAIHEGA